MSTTTGTFNWYNKGKGKIVGGTINLDSPDIRVMLAQSGYTPDQAAHDYVSDVTNEVGGGVGYSRYALVSEAKSEPTAGTWMFDSDNPAWTATGAGITAKWWILYNYNAADASAELIAYGLLDSSTASVTTTSGNVLTIIVPAEGWFRWS